MTFKFLAALLVAYAGWRLWRGWGKPKSSAPVPVRSWTAEDEACATLGVSRDADAETIRAAHRRLIREVHPDAGGTAEQTRRINAARDLLLRTGNR